LYAPSERREIIDDPGIRALLQYWPQTADDTWLLEYLHLLFSELQAHEDMPAGWLHALMPERISHYLQVDPERPFYELGADAFLTAIERIRQHEVPQCLH
jgi:hypothetical protein